MALHNSATEVLIGLLEKKWENIEIQDVNADQLSARTEAFRKQLCEAGTKKTAVYAEYLEGGRRTSIEVLR